MEMLSIQVDSIMSEVVKLEKLLTDNLSELQTIQDNTNLNFFDDGMNLLAVLSLVIAIGALVIEAVTWMGITGTKESIVTEAEKNRVDKECQYRLFQDIIRHLYRNKVCTITMQLKLKKAETEQGEDSDGFVFYPSEEHIQKLKLMPSDIHLEEYYRDSQTYHKLHEMELLLRNYNTEIDTAVLHIPNPDIDIKTKERDYSTLNFKTAFLIVKIVQLMDTMWPERSNMLDAQQIIDDKQTVNRKGNEVDYDVIDDYEDLVEVFAEKESQDGFVKKIYSNGDMGKYIQGLVTDLYIECGTNQRGEEKIHIVRLKTK